MSAAQTETCNVGTYCRLLLFRWVGIYSGLLHFYAVVRFKMLQNSVDEADVDGFGLGGEFWFDDIYAAASLSDVDGEQDFSARVGYMFSDNFLLNGGLADGDSYADPSVLVGAKYVAKLGENFVNLEADLDLNDDNTLMLVGDYFFTNEFSAGVRVTESDADGADTVFGVGARYFFTPVISGEVEYKTADSEDAYGLRVAARF